MIEELRSTMFFPEALNGGNLIRRWLEQILQIVVRRSTRFGGNPHEGKLDAIEEEANIFTWKI